MAFLLSPNGLKRAMQFPDTGSEANAGIRNMRPHTLRVGDRVQVVRLPPMWSSPGFRVPADTRRVYDLMISRRRPVRIKEVDDIGAWVHLCVPDHRGRIIRHYITLDDGCWVRVPPRKRIRSSLT